MEIQAQVCTCPEAHPKTCEFCRSVEVAWRKEANFYCTCNEGTTLKPCKACARVLQNRQRYVSMHHVASFAYNWPADLQMPDRAPSSRAA